MTYDEVMALSGRELDAAVAEHVIGAGSSAAWDYSARIEPALHAMRHILSRGAWAQNMFYAALWGQAPAAICRAAVYVATQPQWQWMGSNDSNQ